MVSTLRHSLLQFSTLPRVLRLVWAASKGWTLAWGILLVVQGLLPAAMVFLTRLLVDGLVDVVGTGFSWDSAQPVVLLGAVMAGLLLMTELSQNAIDWIRGAQAELVQDHIASLVHEKSVALDLAFYESPEFYDRLERAHSDASSRPLALLENAGGLLQNGISLVALASILVPYGAWLPPVLLLSTAPALYVVARFGGRFHRWWQKTTPERRWIRYYDTVLTHSGPAPELRLFGLGGHFQSAYTAMRRLLRNERLTLARRQSLANLAAGVAALSISAGAMAWIVWRAVSGLGTLGDVALFYQAFSRGQNLMRSLLRNVGQVYANSLFIGNLFDFLALKPQVVDPVRPVQVPSPLVDRVAFSQITFRYPGSEHTVLKAFDLTVPIGRTVAIVGPNGAGKSTLVKLLCRLYDPEAGSITVDGIDIRKFSIEELRRHITAMFQFPVPYHATAGDNIALGDLRGRPSAARVQSAARDAGAHEMITRLPEGYDTQLGKWFTNGTELSGGEWQQVALARAFVRDAPIIVLDEPTSFMDSWAEVEWWERFRQLADGRTAIIITHRLTTAMRADEIHVMSHGQIVESGSHRELLAAGGLYAQSWSAQMRNGGAPVTSQDRSPNRSDRESAELAERPAVKATAIRRRPRR